MFVKVRPVQCFLMSLDGVTSQISKDVKGSLLIFLSLHHLFITVKSWPLMDTQKPPFLTFTASHSSWSLVGSPSVDISKDAPHYWNQQTLQTSNTCLVCVWPECLTCLAALIKRSPLWLVASLWCEVWLKVRGCLFASLWDQPTSPCLCLLLLTQSWWLYYTMAHMSLTYVYQWVGVHLWKKGQIWKTTLIDCSDKHFWWPDTSLHWSLTGSLLFSFIFSN